MKAWKPKVQNLRFTEPPTDPRSWGARCDICPLRGQKPVLGDGKLNATLAVVGEAPGREEEERGIPFVGKSGESMTEALERAGTSRSAVWIDNAVACFPPGGDMKAFIQRSKKETKARAQEWHSPVDCCRPRLFFALGIPTCGTCSKFTAGPDACTCPQARPVYPNWKGVERQPARAFLMLGNAAMEALMGVEGITNRQMYVHSIPWRGPDAMVLRGPP